MKLFFLFATFALFAGNLRSDPNAEAAIIAQSAPVSGGGGSAPTPDLLWLKFDGDVTDASGAGNIVTPRGSPGFATGQDGVSDRAISFDGTSQYLDCGATMNFTNEDFSFSIWIKPSSLSGNGNIFLYKGMFQTSGYYVYTDNTGVVGFRSNQSASQQLQLSNAGLISTSSWHHVAITRSGSDVKIFVDGIDQTGSPVPIVNPDASSDNFQVGQYDGNNTFSYAGLVDDLRIYSAALTSAQISAIYAEGAQ